MDYRSLKEEASLELARESLIAISYCESEKIPEPEKASSQDKAVNAVDELRSKLMSIASSELPSMDSVANGV